MEPDRLLETWTSIHGSLTVAQQKSFLERHEVEELCRMPDAAVVHAVGKAAKLAAILRIAQTEGWWYAGEACEPDNLPFCSRCKPHGYPTTVYMTRGWSSAFHKSPTCSALSGGQRFVAGRGGNPADVELVHIQVALGSGRLPCQVCLGT